MSRLSTRSFLSFLSLALFGSVLTFSSCMMEGPESSSASELGTKEQGLFNFRKSGFIVIGNRNSGDVSVIDTKIDEVTKTFKMPQGAGEPTPEPMYVNYVPRVRRFFVGDRANQRTVAYDARTFQVVGSVNVGPTMMHMWPSPNGKTMWVVCIGDGTIYVFDTRTLKIKARISTPDDLVGGGLHDVILDRRFAYVTIGLADGSSVVVKYSQRNFQERGRVSVGGSAHIYLSPFRRNLFVLSQGDNKIDVVNRRKMKIVKTIPFTGAHGAFGSPLGRYTYATDLPGGGNGVKGLYTIDSRTNKVIGGVDTIHDKPHNITTNRAGNKIYLTHAGPQTNVSIYTVSRRNPVPVYKKTVNAGTNPFGLAFVPRLRRRRR